MRWEVDKPWSYRIMIPRVVVVMSACQGDERIQIFEDHFEVLIVPVREKSEIGDVSNNHKGIELLIPLFIGVYISPQVGVNLLKMQQMCVCRYAYLKNIHRPCVWSMFCLATRHVLVLPRYIRVNVLAGFRFSRIAKQSRNHITCALVPTVCTS